jgi:LPS export ABC transporter protein LptC
VGVNLVSVSDAQRRWWVGIFGVIWLAACSAPPTKVTVPKNQENKLTINNFSVEQSDPSGKLWWRLKAKQAVYTVDRKVAKAIDLVGELYQDNQVVLKLSAKAVDVEQDGQKIFLRGDVTAKETRNNLVVLSQELEWRPTEDLLTISKNVRANHPKVQAQGGRGKYVSRKQRLEMFDRIVAWAPEQNIRLQTDYLQWQVDAQKITGNKPVQVEHYRDRQLLEQVNANQLSYSLDQQTVQLQDNVQFKSVNPPITFTAGSARWQVQQQLITAADSLQIIHKQEQATFTANNGAIDLSKNVATLTGNAQGLATRNQAKLRADRLTWQIDNQQIVGTGNVRYQQQEPTLTLTGVKGVGKLQDQSVVVTGNSQQLVETQIIPTDAPEVPATNP